MGGHKLKKNISEIIQCPPFNTIFPVQNSVLTSLVVDMKRNGFEQPSAIACGLCWKNCNSLRRKRS
jgi:hypothetical protein